MLNEPNVTAITRAQSRRNHARRHRNQQLSPTLIEQLCLAMPLGGGEAGPVRVMYHDALGTLDYFQYLGRAVAEQQAGTVIDFAVTDTEQYLALEAKSLIESVAQDYAELLIDGRHQRRQLIGYCLGGLLATEVAGRLLERSIEVVDLSLIDSIPIFIDADEELAYGAIFVQPKPRSGGKPCLANVLRITTCTARQPMPWRRWWRSGTRSAGVGGAKTVSSQSG